ncbi:Interferon-induced GTP-binding protein Mx2 [Grifola frondosa]|uniref:Interferon-induced GTP-binding protein Mx2 n=1 Tax=Grifola frondosa TaxID=5627 RepID=A0A1C7M891_GRIFR|nr:Interferon-induced GTP-binding protein Mx2 [Grifola frondosa]
MSSSSKQQSFRKHFRFSRNLKDNKQSTTDADPLNSESEPESAGYKLASPIPNNMAGDPDTIADSEYARRRRELLKLVKDLRALGAATDMAIPCIAVIGGQSAGKSSLVEAITGINVPRDSGTCTRCPMECIIWEAESKWTCQVSLRRTGETSDFPFSPVLTSKNEVEIWLRRAQTAILSPHRAAAYFTAKGREDLRSLTKDDPEMHKFSSDVVVIEIHDPEGADLSFVDLPGLIQNEEQAVIDLIRGLVNHYIKSDSTIILVTMPASDDIENQEAMRLAKQADPEGKRTIGVITKPDSLTAGASSARQKWQEILEGRDHQLRHGYYSVRLPDDDERKKNLSRVETERLATNFFSTTEPFKNMVTLNRLGIPHLIRYVSKLLMMVIQDSLPKLGVAVRQRLAECKAELRKLPEPAAGDAATEILHRVIAFCDDLQDAVCGRGEDKTFVHRSRATYEQFKVAIRKTAPNFRPFEDSTRCYKPPEFAPEVGDYGMEDNASVAGTASPEDTASLPSEGTQVIGLYDVREVIRLYFDRMGVTHNLPYDAKKRLIKDFMDGWPAPAQKCFDDISSILSKTLSEFVATRFGRFKALEQHIERIVRGEMEKYGQRGTQSLAQVLERECEPYFTQNKHYLESTRSKWLTHYKLVRCTPLLYAKTQLYESYEDLRESSPVWRALRALADAGYHNLSAGDLVRLLPPDRFEDELIVMADVRSYFQVAYKRVIDDVPMTIHHALVQEMANNMQKRLLAELKIGSVDASQRLKDLLAEDPADAAKRKQLTELRKQLEAIKKKLDNFFV